MKPVMMPSVLPIVFLPPQEFDEVREESEPDVNHDLPYRVEHDGVWIGYGIRGEMGACVVEPIANTDTGRVAQVRKTNRNCDTCERFKPDVEVVVPLDTGETMVGYICNECFEEHVNAQATIAHDERQREDQAVLKRARAIKKRERQNRRRSRKRG